MFKLKSSPRFERNLRQLLKKNPSLVAMVRQRLKLMQTDVYDTKLKTHALSGKLKGLYAASLTYEYRIVFEITDTTLELIAIGSHDEVY